MRLAVKSELCSGCRVCELTCAASTFGEQNPSKATLVVHAQFPVPGNYTVSVCDQCGECAQVCPVDAINNDDGYWKVNPEECIGCLACVEACPNGVMRQHASETAPFKCTSCGECIKYCPREALYDGEAVGA